jgi:hypothetical protein
MRGTAATEARCAAASAAGMLPRPARHAAARQLQSLVGRLARRPLEPHVRWELEAPDG